MRKLLTTFLMLSVMLFLAGCCGSCPDRPSPSARVVTRITIACDDEVRTFGSEESMKAILAYLRNLTPLNLAESSPTQGCLYRITLLYSDGSHREYTQQDRFFREGNGKWKSISEQNSLALSKLYDLLEPESTLSAT